MPELPPGFHGFHPPDEAGLRRTRRYLFTGQRTCIDCHKGIAHLLPDMKGVDPGLGRDVHGADVGLTR